MILYSDLSYLPPLVYRCLGGWIDKINGRDKRTRVGQILG